MQQALTITTDSSCDICGDDFDASSAVDVNSTSTCPCCSGADRRTHGLDFQSFRKRK